MRKIIYILILLTLTSCGQELDSNIQKRYKQEVKVSISDLKKELSQYQDIKSNYIELDNKFNSSPKFDKELFLITIEYREKLKYYNIELLTGIINNQRILEDQLREIRYTNLKHSIQIDILNRKGAIDFTNAINNAIGGFEIIGDCNKPNIKVIYIGDLKTPLTISNVDLYISGSIQSVITEKCNNSTINKL